MQIKRIIPIRVMPLVAAFCLLPAFLPVAAFAAGGYVYHADGNDDDDGSRVAATADKARRLVIAAFAPGNDPAADNDNDDNDNDNNEDEPPEPTTKLTITSKDGESSFEAGCFMETLRE